MVVSKVEFILNIPPNQIEQARSLFMYTLISFFLSLYSSLINVTLYAKNRLDYLNIIKILRIGVKVIFTVLFFEILAQEVYYIGYASVLSEIIVLLTSIYLYRRTIFKGVRVSYRFFEKTALWSMFNMTIWVVVHQIGDTFLYRIDNILVNKFWSTRESGILGAFSEFGTYVMIVVSVISSLFGPLILIAYSKGNQREVKELAIRNSLIVGVSASLLVGILVGFSRPIIGLWLGYEYTDFNNWFVLKLITIPFYVAAGIFSFVNRAMNKVFLPAVITVLFGIINLIVSYLILLLNYKNHIFITYMLMSSAIFIILQSYFLNAYSIIRVYPDIKIKLISGFLKILTSLFVVTAMSFFYGEIFKTRNLFEVILGIASVFFVTFPVLFFIVFKHSERIFVKEQLLIILNRFQGSDRNFNYCARL